MESMDVTSLQYQFWQKKMRTAFSVFDADKDGIITVDDIILIAERFGKKCPERAKEIKDLMLAMWDNAAGSRDAKLGMKAFIDLSFNYFAKPDSKAKFSVNAAARFKIINLDGSGFISVKEFTDYFECMGIDTKHAPASFAAIDTNGDGQISREEFIDAAVEFVYGLEGGPSDLFYGPLVD